jgi:hypothetical protein
MEPTRTNMLRLVETEEPSGPNPFTDENYPLVPIGVGAGTTVHFLDSHGQYQAQMARDLSRNNLQKWFSARPDYLLQHFPRPKKGQNSDEAETFKPEMAADQLINACAHFGFWEPKNKLCGRGAWLGEDGDLVLHTGDRLWIGGRYVGVGRRGDKVYPRAPSIMRPAKESQGFLNGPGEQLLTLLDRWAWQRPDIDALLLLGWIGSALIGGALKVRPALWLTGLAGTGKSSLLQIIAALFDSGRAVVFSTDATAAAVWQTLGADSLPVMLDEAERQVDNRKVENLVLSMRASYSGGFVARGGSDGIAHQYPVRSSFLFSSINVIPLRAQDHGRCAILQMQPLTKGPSVSLPFSEMPGLGRAILRRMVDNFSRLIAEVQPDYLAALLARGWEPRGADTIGTLLACASVLRRDQHDVQADIEEFETDLNAMRESQKIEEAPDYLRCIDHLLDSQIAPTRGGELRPIGELIRVAAGYGLPQVSAPLQGTMPAHGRDARDALLYADQDEHAREAARALGAYGIKVVLMPDDGRRDLAARRMVAVANTGAGLQQLFNGTHWQGMSGTLGGWRQVLARTPGAEFHPKPIRFRGGLHRAVLLPLEQFLRLDDEADSL